MQQTLDDAAKEEQKQIQPVVSGHVPVTVEKPPKKKRGRNPKEKTVAEVQPAKAETITDAAPKEAPAANAPPVPPEQKESPENRLMLKVLMAFPDITFEMAKKLLRTYGSFDAILTATKPELMDVPGMTDKAASAILWVMKRKWADKK